MELFAYNPFLAVSVPRHLAPLLPCQTLCVQRWHASACQLPKGANSHTKALVVDFLEAWWFFCREAGGHMFVGSSLSFYLLPQFETFCTPTAASGRSLRLHNALGLQAQSPQTPHPTHIPVTHGSKVACLLLRNHFTVTCQGGEGR